MPGLQEKCYDAHFFKRFLDEQIDEQEESELLDHLSGCAKCQFALENLAGQQEVWSDIKQHLEYHHLAADHDSFEVLGQDRKRDLNLIKKLLNPTDDPRMIGRLGNYEICGIIGRGSAGIVVKALDPRLNRFVAIKILAPVYCNNGSARRRFEREGRSIASVKDAHVIPVYTVDEYQDQPFIVMQYMPDGSLQQRIEKRGPLETFEVVCVAMQIAKGLSAAHKRGIVHRDVKPANVLLESGVDRAMVTDFGLARVVDEATMTRSGAISGTPQYMSPEQAKGESVDQRSDLFSLGSVMYAACTGHSPFRSETVFGVIKRVCESEPRPIRETNPNIDPWLVAFISKLHAKLPEDRFQSSEKVAELLSYELAHLQAPTIAPSPERKWLPEKPRIRRPIATTGVIAVAAALFALSVSGWFNGMGGFVGNTSGISGLLFPSSFWMGAISHEEEHKNWPRFKKTVETTVDVDSGGVLVLRTSLGSLNVTTHDKKQVEMRLVHTVAAEDQAMADKFLQAMTVQYELDPEEADQFKLATGKDAAINVTFPARKLTSKEIEESDNLEASKEKLIIQNTNYFRDAEFELRIPKTFNLDLRTAAGPIQASDIDGWVKLTANGGSIELDNVTGFAEVKTTHGHIGAQDIGGNATLLASGGTIKVGNIDGELLAHTDRGHVEAEQVSGSADVKTYGGQIQLKHAKGVVVARNSGGRILIEKAEGQVDANAQSGSISVSFVGQPNGNSVLEAGNGTIKVGLEKDIALDIHATCSFGNISGPFIYGKKTSFSDRINDGEQKLNAKTNNGSIKFYYVDGSDSPGEPVNKDSYSYVESRESVNHFQQGYRLHVSGKLDEAIVIYTKAIEFGHDKETAAFNIGCAMSQKGEIDKAFLALNESVTFGFCDFDQFQTDPHLDPVRDDQRFETLLIRVKERKSIEDLVSEAVRAIDDEKYAKGVTLCRSALKLDPENELAAFRLGFALHLNGEIDEAIKWHQRSSNTEQYRTLGNYNLACAYSIKNEPELAFEYLDNAVDAGFFSIEHMDKDADLDKIRNDPRFQKVVERAKRKMTEEGIFDSTTCTEFEVERNEKD